MDPKMNLCGDFLAQISALEIFWKTIFFPESQARKIENSFGLRATHREQTVPLNCTIAELYEHHAILVNIREVTTNNVRTMNR